MTYPQNGLGPDETTIIDIARRVGLIEDARDEAARDLKQAWSDAREQFRAAGLSGQDVSREVGYLKAAIAASRKSAEDQAKADEREEGAGRYLEIISSPRARARAREDRKTDSAAIAPKPVAADTPEVARRASGDTQSTAPRMDGDGQKVTVPASAEEGRSGHAPLAGSLPEQETNVEPGAEAAAPPVDTQSQPSDSGAPTSLAGVEGDANRHPIPEGYQRSTTGLLRLAGCQKPDCCGSTSPRSALCFTCARAHSNSEAAR